MQIEGRFKGPRRRMTTRKKTIPQTDPLHISIKENFLQICAFLSEESELNCII